MAYNTIVTKWSDEFTERIRTSTKSTKHVFTYFDAVKKSKRYCNEFDIVMIQYVEFIESNPLRDAFYDA